MSKEQKVVSRIKQLWGMVSISFSSDARTLANAFLEKVDSEMSVQTKRYVWLVYTVDDKFKGAYYSKEAAQAHQSGEDTVRKEETVSSNNGSMI